MLFLLRKEADTMFGLGVPELLLILLIGLIIFGPGKLPSIGSAVSKSLREFKTAVNDTAAPVKEDAETVKAEGKNQSEEGQH